VRSRKPVTPTEAALALAYIAIAVVWRAAHDLRNIYRWAHRR
jgi:hypothetical protein